MAARPAGRTFGKRNVGLPVPLAARPRPARRSLPQKSSSADAGGHDFPKRAVAAKCRTRRFL